MSKRVVYLDQWALCYMMKALNPDTPAYKEGKMDQRWGDMFRKLHRLVLLQLIVCPGSEFHRRETLVYDDFRKEVEQIDKLLSGGAELVGAQTIRDGQLCEHARLWATGASADAATPALEVQDVVDGDLESWQDLIMLPCNLRVAQEHVDAVRRSRQESVPAMQALFNQWRSEKRSRDYWFREAVSAYGEAVLRPHLDPGRLLASLLFGTEAVIASDAFSLSSALSVSAIRDGLRRAGVPSCDLGAKTIEYLRSDRLAEVPFLQLSATLYASEAGKVASGKNEPPNRGFVTDVGVISTFLPYCDAMLIDSQCANHLRETGAHEPYGTQIFSRRSLDGFIEYLNEIEKGATQEHLARTVEVYGADCGQPYDTLFADQVEPDPGGT